MARPQVPRLRQGKVRLATWNSHVSIGLRRGQLKWVLDRYPGLTVLTVEEVKKRKDLVTALRRSGHADRYEIFPRRAYRGTSAMVYHLVRRSDRFVVEEVSTRRMRSGKYRRELLETVVHDRRTGRAMHLIGFHIDPLGRGLVRADPRARARHMNQAQDVADAFADVPPANVAIGGGDGNEKLTAALPASWRPRSLRGRMLRVGAVPSHAVTARGDRWAGLDDTWHRRAPFVRVINRRRAAVPGGQAEHPVVVTTFEIDAL